MCAPSQPCAAPPSDQALLVVEGSQTHNRHTLSHNEICATACAEVVLVVQEWRSAQQMMMMHVIMKALCMAHC